MAVKEAFTGVVATAAGLAAVVIHYLPASGPPREAPVVVALAGAVTIAFAVLIFAGALPRARRGEVVASGVAEIALVTSGVGFLCVATAWTGLPFVLGAGGTRLGVIARRRVEGGGRRGMATAAIALGAAAVALGCFGLVVD